MTDERDITLDEMLDPTEEQSAEAPPSDDLVDEDDPDLDEDFDATPRRRVGWVTRGLAAGILLALAFTGGVLVQKHHDAGASAGSLPAFSGGVPNGGGGFPGFGGTQGSSTSDGSASSSGSQGGGSTPAVIGTVVSVHGNRIIVRDLSGTKHVVTTTGSTTITRSTELPVSKLTAGTTVVVVGAQADDGTTSATTVTVR
jgi:hypothetical protein